MRLRNVRLEMRCQCGFALLSVLLSMSAIMVVLVVSMAIVISARRNVSAHVDSFNVELAIASAQEDALGLLAASTNTEHFVCYESGDYDVISWFDPSRGKWLHQPLVSGGLREDAAIGQGDSFMPFSGEVPLGDTPVVMKQKEREVKVPRIIVDADISYGYWIEDLNGNLDYEALVYGGDRFDPHLTGSEKVRMNDARVYEQRHIGLSAFSTGENGDREAPVDFSDPHAPRAGMVHPLRELIDKGWERYMVDSSIVKSELAEEYQALGEVMNVGLAHTVGHEVVPYGYHYPNAGSLKMNLNAVLEDEPHAAVAAVTAQVKMVPGFKDSISEYEEAGITVDSESPDAVRYGAFPASSESYCRTLAASIIDYVDLDSAPCLERSLSSGNYRGIDAFPYVTEASRRYYLSDATANGAVLQIRNFVELYNPSNHPTAGYLKYRFIPSPDHRIQVGGSEYSLPQEDLYYWGGAITIPPNSYRVVEVTQDLDGDFIGDNEAYLHYELAAAGTAITASRPSSSGNRLEVLWCAGAEQTPGSEADFLLVDGHLHGGFTVSHTSLIDTSYKNANNTLYGIPLYEGMTGDVRNTIYCRRAVGALNYAKRTSFGGPNDYQVGESGQYSPSTRFPDPWYDPGYYGIDVRGCTSSPTRGMRYPGEYGYVRWDDPEGVMSQNLEGATGSSGSQFYVNPPADNAARYIQRISNKGYFTSLGELGNIYDPAQWGSIYRPAEEGVTGAASGAEEDELGGGMTLAIGSPEFNRFSRPGYEAARLLDQFRVTDSAVRSLQGRVNLNTAPRSVLQALFTGFLHEDDAVIGSFTQQARNASGEVASVLADGIIAARSERPFLSLSDIALAKVHSQGEELQLFGEKLWYRSSDAVVNNDVWNDVGREELFRKMNDLFTTQSRSYRVHLQLEIKRNGLTSQVRREIDVTLHPQLSPSQQIVRGTHSAVKIHRLLKK